MGQERAPLLGFSAIDAASFRPLRRWEYYRLGEMGAFEGERVELLEGVVVSKMSPQSARHAYVIDELTQRFVQLLKARAKVRVQQPLALSKTSEPEPDLAVVAPGDYLDAHPESAWLVVEVALTSLVTDLQLKARLYAEAGVTEYWVVDVAAGRLVVHREPAGSAYATVFAVGRSERIALVAFPDVELEVEGFVPAPG